MNNLINQINIEKIPVHTDCGSQANKFSQCTFWAMVAHDLKTPINAVICALELLLKSPLAKGFELELINDTLNATKYMKNLVENLLIKYKSEKNEFTLQIEPCPIENIINRCLDEVNYLAKDKNQKIIFTNKTKDSTCDLDFIEIKRTLNNLLANANQYAPQKSTITIQLKENKKDFIIEIINLSEQEPPQKNNPKSIEKLIEENNQTKTINASLGLLICKKIIELHGGELRYEKLPKCKNKFWFTLPKSPISLK